MKGKSFVCKLEDCSLLEFGFTTVDEALGFGDDEGVVDAVLA